MRCRSSLRVSCCTPGRLLCSQFGGMATAEPPAHVSRYADAEYWDERFQEEESYEWFRGYDSFRHLVERSVKPHHRVLILGCGNSALAEDLCRLSGVADIVSTDLSATVVERMRARAQQRGLPATLTWEVADMCSLPFESSSFDAVIEKGVLDCLHTVVRDPWNVPDEVKATCRQALEEAHRVLRPHGGCFISITFSAPHFRRPLLRDGPFTWRVAHDTFGGEWQYHSYTCATGQKGADEVEPDERLTDAHPWTGEPLTHEYMDEPDFLLRCGLD